MKRESNLPRPTFIRNGNRVWCYYGGVSFKIEARARLKGKQ